VAELDTLLGGGLDHGTATLLIGPAGSGKSALATQFVVAAAAAGDRAAIYTFDESVFTLRARAEALEVGLEPHIQSGVVAVHQVDPAEMSPGQFAHHLCQAVERDHARVVVIDSLTGYLNAMPEERFLLNQLHEVLTYMGQQGVVTILVATQHGLFGQAMVTPIDVSYLADNVLLLRYFEARGSVRNAISVLKRRSGSHERSIREFTLGRGGIKIGPSLKDFHGVLTGVPTYTGDANPLMDGHGAGAT
jgi:circadian clock protein KaiC